MPGHGKKQLTPFDRADMEAKLRDRVDESTQERDVAVTEKEQEKTDKEVFKSKWQEAKNDLKQAQDVIKDLDREVERLLDIIETKSNCPPEVSDEPV